MLSAVVAALVRCSLVGLVGVGLELGQLRGNVLHERARHKAHREEAGGHERELDVVGLVGVAAAARAAGARNVRHAVHQRAGVDVVEHKRHLADERREHKRRVAQRRQREAVVGDPRRHRREAQQKRKAKAVSANLLENV